MSQRRSSRRVSPGLAYPAQVLSNFVGKGPERTVTSWFTGKSVYQARCWQKQMARSQSHQGELIRSVLQRCEWDQDSHRGWLQVLRANCRGVISISRLMSRERSSEQKSERLARWTGLPEGSPGIREGMPPTPRDPARTSLSFGPPFSCQGLLEAKDKGTGVKQTIEVGPRGSEQNA